MLHKFLWKKGVVMTKKKFFVILTCCLGLSLLLAAAAAAQPKVGDKVGNLQVNKPMNEADMKYLGLDKMGPFTLKDIKADYVLLDAFSTLCPHCIQQAPHLNKLYNLVSQNAKMKDKLKFVAAGYQDNDMKLNAWKAIQKVPFPLISDMDGAVFNALKLPGTPVSVILDKQGKVLWVHVGAFEDADAVLKDIKSALKL
jgi:peroxiredoxin